MKPYLLLAFIILFALRCGPQGDTGPTGPQGLSPEGQTGADGPTGLTGAMGEFGASGGPGQDAECLNSPAPEIGEIAVIDNSALDGGYLVQIALTYSGTLPLSCSLSDIGGLFHLTDSTDSSRTYFFEPFQAGLLLNTVLVSNGCNVAAKDFEIRVQPNWHSVGSRNFSGGDTRNPYLAIDKGIAYIAFIANGSIYPAVYKVSVLKQINGREWEDLGQPGATQADTPGTSKIPMALALFNGSPYTAFSDRENDYRVTLKRYVETDGAGGGGSWETIGPPGFSGNGVDWVSLAIDQGIPYVAYHRLNGGDYVSVSRFYNNNWEYLGGADRFDMAVRPSLSVYEGTAYLAYENLTGDPDTHYIRTYFYTGGNWQIFSPGDNFFGGNPAISVYQGTPFIAYYNFFSYKKKISVARYNGNSWVEKDNPWFEESAQLSPVLTGSDGNIYLAYLTASHQEVRVARLSLESNRWAGASMDMASTLPSEFARDVSIFVDGGIPYIAYSTNLYEDFGLEYYRANFLKYPLQSEWVLFPAP